MTKPSPPKATERPQTITLHGDTRQDPYAWLKDENWQEVMRDPARLNPDIRDYLEAENAFTQASLKDTESLQEALFQEMKGRIKEDDATVPAPDGDYAYYRRYRTGGEHPMYCRHVGGAETQEEVLLDGDKEADGKAFFKIGAVTHSPDHKRLAYCVDDKGSEFYELRHRDVETGKDLKDTIPQTTGNAVWSADSAYIFYTLLNENHRPFKVMRHCLGTSPQQDELVYEEHDPGFFLGLHKTESDDFILISAHDHETSEVHVIPAETPLTPPRLIHKRQTKLEYDVAHHGDHLFLLTNADGAEDYKIVRAPLASPSKDKWRDLVPHRPGTLILDMCLFQSHLVRLERVNALPRIVISHLRQDGNLGEEHIIAFEEEAYALGLMPGFEFDTTILRFNYSSPTTPAQVFDYDMETRERVLRKTQEVPSGHNPADYVTRRFTAKGHDGAGIPVTVLHRKELAIDGTAPTLLYGYGSYGHAIPAGFSTARLSLVDRGFVYAIAHIRGGMECGYAWYTSGKLDKKTNTFKDFISVAQSLIEQNYTSKSRIIAQGGSAGGMLMGAIANMAPELFLGLIAEVPFVDVLNTMCDDTLPLTPPEWPEWGNPLESKSAYETIKAYSPYDNVTAQDYPHMLVTAGLTDPRVTYWEPAKWVAKLRATKTDENLLLLKTNMEAGHAGAAGRFDQLKEVALNYAFALMISGKERG